MEAQAGPEALERLAQLQLEMALLTREHPDLVEEARRTAAQQDH